MTPQEWTSRLNTLRLPALEHPYRLSDEDQEKFFQRIMRRYTKEFHDPGDPGFSIDTGVGLGVGRGELGAGTPYGLFDEIGLERADPSEVKNLGNAGFEEEPYSAYLEPLRPRLSGDAALAEDLYRRNTPPIGSNIEFPTETAMPPLAQPPVERTISSLASGGGEVETIEQPEVKQKVTTDSDGHSTTEEIVTQPAKTIEPKPSRDPSITSFSVMQKYDEWEKEFLQKLKAQADSRRKKDFWFGTDTADSTWQNGLAFLKTMRAGAQSQADYLAEQELMGGLFDTDNPVQAAAERGANLEQLLQVAEVQSAMAGDPDPMGEKIKQALFASQGWWNTLSDEQQKVELSQYGTPDNAIKNYAAKLVTDWNNKPVNQVTLNQGMETSYQRKVGEALAAAPIEVYTDQDNKYTNAQADLDRISLAINLLESGNIQTGPLTKPWLSTMRFVNQVFGGGNESQVSKIQDARKQSLMRNPTNRQLADYEFFDSLSTLLGARLIQLTKGNVTEREMMMFLRIAPELSKTPEGNLILLKILRNMNQKIVDYQSAARRYMKDSGFPKDGAAWMTWMQQQPEVTKWLGDEDGLGGIIEREWYDRAIKNDEPYQGIPIPTGGFSVIGEGIPGDWGADIAVPFQWQGDDGVMHYYIVKNGLLYEVRVNQ